ncbi:hypothetical protein EV702DRAFT_181587 [Suillus placidus]|uniref:Uncharacterized protein n=1 Tax=Suillus placidus TaxID=48579 RepID=A0A9P7CVS8_9AGAM|nr:hypothetical protein EV702DRAFT_181587 [Suillus placidus]
MIQDSHRLPEGIKRIAYDADTQQYTFRDRSGQLYQNPSGETYGVLKAVSAPAAPRRSVTITARRDPALIRARSVKRPAKTFDDFLPPEYITNAGDSSSAPDSPSEDIARVKRNRSLPKIPRFMEVMRPRAISPRKSEDDEKHHLLFDDRSTCPVSYATHHDEKELSRSNSNASSFLSLPIIDTHINFE